MQADLDLGNGRTLQWTRWAPDRHLNPQYEGQPDIERIGAILSHPDRRDPSRPCEGGILFDRPGVASAFPDRDLWRIEQENPLTISPSVLCGACGDHGFIRDGNWVEA